MLGQRQQQAPLALQRLAHREVALSRHGTDVSDLVAPATKLGVQIIDVAKRSGGEKRRSKVLNLSFDSSLLIPARRAQGRGAKW